MSRLFSKDNILLVAGLLGVGYETLSEKAEKPTLLLLFACMMGLDAFMRIDGIKEAVISRIKGKTNDE